MHEGQRSSPRGFRLCPRVPRPWVPQRPSCFKRQSAVQPNGSRVFRNSTQSSPTCDSRVNPLCKGANIESWIAYGPMITNGLDDVLRTEIWAQLMLRSEDRLRILDFFARETSINVSCVSRRMHLTVYFAAAGMPGVAPVSEKTCISVPTIDTRFMLMTVGGEVAKPGAEPTNHKIGIRIQKRSAAMVAINEFRARLVRHESRDALGGRAPTTLSRSAFGASFPATHDSSRARQRRSS
jgi:hypothetical protein